MDDRRRLQKLESLFAKAVELPESERRAFVIETFGEDAELGAELQAMLDADQSSSSGQASKDSEESHQSNPSISDSSPESKLDSRQDSEQAPISTPQDTLAEVIGKNAASLQESDSTPGSRVGPYTVDRVLGAGGMGTVYLAQRDDDAFDKQVAIKKMRAGWADEEARKRFRTERQILASLEHPNIARLLDGGETAEGEPYVVMEYVEGVPIDVYCKENNINLDARLKLFRQVCDAVRAAHARLIIHRDLKPANILVTSDGTPKLLDFGIAKLLDPSQATHTIAETSTGLRLLTPEYASPEQVRGETMTTAVDVYALGVVLFEILAERRPFQFENRMQREIERVICEEEPPRPSDVTDRFARQLRGDLDNIVGMALRKEPERRYPGVDPLDEDIRRYLEGLPVSARETTWGYRASKFMKRNWLAVAVVTVFVGMLAGFAFMTDRQARATAVERDRALVEAQTSERVTDFVVGVFDASAPGTPKDREPTASELLDVGYENIKDQLQDEPAVRAKVLDALGGVYLSLDQFEKGNELVEESLEIKKGLFEGDHESFAHSFHLQGNYDYSMGNYEEARGHYTDSLEMRRRLYGEGSIELARSYGGLAAVAAYLREVEDALKLRRQVYELYLASYGPEDARTVSASVGVAGRLMAIGNTEEAEAQFREALGQARKVFGDDHLEVANITSDLAVMLRRQKKFEEAEKFYLETLRIRRAAFPEDNSLLAQILGNYAMYLRETEQYEEAEKHYLESLAMYERLNGPEHPDVALQTNNLAGFYNKIGESEKAEPIYQRAFDLYMNAMGEKFWITRVVQANHAKCLIDLKRYEEAEPKILDAYQALLEILGPEQRHTLAARETLVRLYDETDRRELADPLRPKKPTEE